MTTVPYWRPSTAATLNNQPCWVIVLTDYLWKTKRTPLKLRSVGHAHWSWFSMTCIRLYSLFLTHTCANTHVLQLIGIQWGPGRGSFAHIWTKEETGQVCVVSTPLERALLSTQKLHTQRDVDAHTKALMGFFCCACAQKPKAFSLVTS